MRSNEPGINIQKRGTGNCMQEIRKTDAFGRKLEVALDYSVENTWDFSGTLFLIITLHCVLHEFTFNIDSQ